MASQGKVGVALFLQPSMEVFEYDAIEPFVTGVTGHHSEPMRGLRQVSELIYESE